MPLTTSVSKRPQYGYFTFGIVLGKCLRSGFAFRPGEQSRREKGCELHAYRHKQADRE